MDRSPIHSEHALGSKPWAGPGIGWTLLTVILLSACLEGKVSAANSAAIPLLSFGAAAPNLLVERNETTILDYRAKSYSFRYPSSFTPLRDQLGTPAHQMLLATAAGSILMVVAFSERNPCPMVDDMLSDLHQPTIKAGYEVKIVNATKVLNDGTRVTGKRSESSSKNTKSEIDVFCHQKSNHGLLIITQFNNAAPQQDRDMIDLFWSSLTITP